MDSLDYEVQCDQRDYAKAQLEVLKQIEAHTNNTRTHCKCIFLNTLVIAVLVIIVAFR